MRHVEFFGGWNHVYSGDVIPPGETVFLISNHKTWIDWLTLMSLAARKGRLGNFKMFAKKSISLVPVIGWGMWLMNFVHLIAMWSSPPSWVYCLFSRSFSHAIGTQIQRRL